MGLSVTAKTDLPPVPAALADVALIDAPSIAATASMAISTWLDLVRNGDAPQPVLRGNRCTRWLMADVRNWLVERASKPLDDDALIARSTKASRAAKAKRDASRTGA